MERAHVMNGRDLLTLAVAGRAVNSSRWLVFAAAIVLASGVFMPIASAPDDAQPSPTEAPRALTHSRVIEAHAGFITDLALVAVARGWTLEQAVAHRAISDQFGRIQEQLATKRPGLYAGATLSAVPDGAPTLYIRGTADAFVRELVNAAEFRIEVIEGQPFSWQELEERSIRLNRLLAALGFRDIVTSFDESTATVEAVVTRVPALPASAEQVLALLPAEFRSGVRLDVTDADVAIDEHAYGGMWVRDFGVNECTSGWSVTDGVTTGVTTAGHCDGINEIVEPGVGVHRLIHRAEHRGQWGDVEWKTSLHMEPPDAHMEHPAAFYASETEVRAVAAVEPQANITVREAICVYGRSSNAQDCSHTVYRTSISCTSNGVFNDRLVAMNAKNTTIPGDSGGPWYFNFTAYGSHKGGCTIDGAMRNVFSVADLYDEALGVTVRR
jgi:streptogrisin C